MKTIAFFNNKGGVGKTSLVYHLAWMLHRMGKRVIAVDLDPQSNLTSAFLDDDQLEALWSSPESPGTILGSVQPLMQRLGNITDVPPYVVEDGLALIPGDLGLSQFEDRLSQAWRDCNSDNKPDADDAFRVMTAFYRVAINAGRTVGANVGLVDVGPNIGAMNRGALVASDYVVIPLGADLFSLQGLRNLGPTLQAWRSGWQDRANRPLAPRTMDMPTGQMSPIGYVLLNPSVRTNRPVKAYKKWADKIPQHYSTEILREPVLAADHQLAMIKHFKSLMPLAQESRKPMFLLDYADGAIGGHAAAVSECYVQFESLARKLMGVCGI